MKNDNPIDVQTPVLDHGFIRLVDYMGGDAAIAEAARVSYSKGTKRINDTKGLIRYLYRHRHTSPFEMCVLKFHVKCPMFVARQWLRHRTASVNEVSARYSILPCEMYVPSKERLCKQSVVNKQGSGEEIEDEIKEAVLDSITVTGEMTYECYETLLNQTGLARELARGVLPAFIYTEFYWKMDLHNLLHFIKLRMHPHAQYEIQVYAEKIAEVIRTLFPETWDAFEEYSLYAVTLSRSQIAAVRRMLAGDPPLVPEADGMSGREREDLNKIIKNIRT